MKAKFIKLYNYALINVPLSITELNLLKREENDRCGMKD